MLRVVAFSAALVASTAVFAQNIAVANSKPIPKAREDAWVEQLKKQGQQDTPQLRAQRQGPADPARSLHAGSAEVRAGGQA